MSRKLFAILLACVMLIGVIGCAQAPAPAAEAAPATEAAATEAPAAEEAKQIVIGASMGQETPFYKLISDNLEAKATELGAKVIILNANNDSEKQLDDVDNLIAQQVDVIVLSPVDADSVNSALQAAKAAGIPVIETISATSDESFDIFVGTQEYDAGAMQAAWLVENCGETGKLCILMGPAGQTPSIKRYEGLTENLPAGWEIVAEQHADWARDKGMSITEDWLNIYTDITAIMAQNDEMALGAAQACATTGRTDIAIGGVDGLEDACAAIVDGTMSMSVYQDGATMGQRCAEFAVGLANGETFDKFCYVPFIPITASNVADFQ